MRRRLISTAALGLSALACLAFAQSASALGLTNLSAQPGELSAGANSDFAIHIEITQPADDLKDLTIHLPPGMVGDPNATPKCSLAQLNAASCPTDTQVGTSGSVANILGVPIPGITQVTVSGGIYNVAPQPGEPARFGIVLQPAPPLDVLSEPIILQSGAALREGDFGLDTVLTDLPNTATVLGLNLPIDLVALDVALFGEAGNPPQPFMRNPTSCDEKVTSFTATSYANPNTDVEADAPSFTPTGCEQLEFSPELTATLGAPGLTSPPRHPPLTTVIEQEATEAGLKRAEVILPAGIAANNSALETNCSEAQFDAGNCPDGSEIGSAEAASPLLTSPLLGTAYVLILEGGNLGVGLDLSGELALKLKGQFVFSPDLRTGNLFEGLPDIPISRFALTIDGGSDGLLTATRDLCEPPDSILDSTFDGHNGGHLEAPTTATIEGCGTTGEPTASVTLRKRGSSKPKLRMKVKAGSDAVRSAKLRLPKRRLRFAGNEVFAAGARAADSDGPLPGSALKRSPRRVVVTTDASGGTNTLKLLVRKGALRRVSTRGKLRFKLKVVDADGDVTKLTVKPRR